MRRFVLMVLLLVTALSTGISAVHAQQAAQLQVNNLGITYEFGNYIIFQAQISLATLPSEAYLLFRADGEDLTHVIPISLDNQGNTSQRYEMSEGPIRPYSTVRFHYRIKLQTGEELTSEEYFFQYEDNRFTWQTLTAGIITLHWYQGDLAFGQAALDVAERGLKKIEEQLLVSPTDPINIYIYATSADQDKALEIGGLSSSVGGHASPDLRLAFVSIAPGLDQGLEMDQKIPHEMAHIFTYGLLAERYSLLPVWLSEGLASQFELASNPDYPLALQKASDQGAVIDMADLCGAFPPERGRQFLAYAQSESFTRYIIDKYGQTGLLALISAYGDGQDCSQGMQRSIGQSLAQVETDWRTAVLGENAGWSALKKLFPYLAILFVLLTVSLISAFSVKRPGNDGE